MLYEAAPFLRGRTKKENSFFSRLDLCVRIVFCISPFKNTFPQLCQTCTDLCKVIYESEMSPLQLCPRQCRQGVGIVQLSAVVRWKQVRIQANHMGRICKTQEDTFIMSDSTW